MDYQPNILWLNTDHQIFANRSENASNLPLQRRLAKCGVAFDNAYTALPVCSPSRASMLTGRYPHNHGLTENDGRFGGRTGLDGSDRLINQAFLDAGFRCGWFGKWHLNNHLSASDFGFEGYGPAGYGYPYGSERYRAYLAKYGLPEPTVSIELPGESGTPTGTLLKLSEQEDWFDYEAGSALLHTPVETHEAFFVADLAKDWLSELGDDPFFCRVDTWGPHPPYLVGAPFSERFNDLVNTSENLPFDLQDRPAHHPEYRDYWRETLVNGADDYQRLSNRALQQAALCETALLGVLDALDELGRLEHTIVVFSADHGDAVGSNGGVCNKGGLMVEETLRIPLYFAGPGIKTGRDRTLISNVDIAPTIADLCDLCFPNADGVNLRPLLEGSGNLSRPGIMSEHYGLATPQQQRAYHAAHWKLVLQEDGFTELYDLANDPCEMKNLANDPVHSETLQTMLSGMRMAMEDSQDSTFSLPDLSA